MCCNHLIPKLWALFVFIRFHISGSKWSLFKNSSCDDAEACVVLRALTERGFSELNFTSFAPQEDAGGTVWLNDKTTFGGEREMQEIQTKMSSRRSWRGQLETFKSSFKDGKLCRTEWNGLNLRLKEQTCERTHCWTGREDPPLYCTLLRCWACLPAAAAAADAGFRGAHWQPLNTAPRGRLLSSSWVCVLSPGAVVHSWLSVWRGTLPSMKTSVRADCKGSQRPVCACSAKAGSSFFSNKVLVVQRTSLSWKYFQVAFHPKN